MKNTYIELLQKIPKIVEIEEIKFNDGLKEKIGAEFSALAEKNSTCKLSGC